MKRICAVVGAPTPVVAAGLRSACAESNGTIICTRAATHLHELMDTCQTTRPRVAVVDPNLLKPDRVAAIVGLASLGVQTLLFADDAELPEMAALLRAGAAGVVGRDASLSEPVDGITAAAAGTLVLDASVTRRLLAEHERTDPVRLTPRELEIIALMAAGRSNKKIAAALFISTTTVKTHIERAQDKLGTRGRAAVVAQAIRLGLLVLPTTAAA